jgi:hypothetical protein
MDKEKEKSESVIAQVSTTNEETMLRYQWEPVSWLLSGNDSNLVKPAEPVNLLAGVHV